MEKTKLNLGRVFADQLERNILDRFMHPEYVDIDNILNILENVVDELRNTLTDDELNNLSFVDYITGIYTLPHMDFIDPGLLVDSYTWLGKEITENDCRELMMAYSPFVNYEPILQVLRDEYGLCKGNKNKDSNKKTTMAKKTLTQYFKEQAIRTEEDSRNILNVRFANFKDYSGRKPHEIFMDVIKEELVKAYNGSNTINLEFKDIHKALSTVVNMVKELWDEDIWNEDMIGKITFADYVKEMCRAETIKFIIPGLLVDSYIWLVGSDRITEEDCKELSTNDGTSIYYRDVVKEIKDRYGLCKEKDEYVPVEVAILITDEYTYVFNKDNMHMYKNIEGNVNIKHSIYIFKDGNGELATLCNAYHKFDNGKLYVKVNKDDINKSVRECIIPKDLLATPI